MQRDDAAPHRQWRRRVGGKQPTAPCSLRRCRLDSPKPEAAKATHPAPKKWYVLWLGAPRRRNRTLATVTHCRCCQLEVVWEVNAGRDMASGPYPQQQSRAGVSAI